jgi:hypothetical protein
MSTGSIVGYPQKGSIVRYHPIGLQMRHEKFRFKERKKESRDLSFIKSMNTEV